MLQSQGPPSLLGWLQNYRKWMKDKIVRKQVFRHLSCPTLRSTYFTSRQWSHVGKRKEAAVTTHKSLLVLTGSCWFCFEHWFLEGVGWSLSLLILFLLQFRGNPWCRNGLAKPNVVSQLRGDWVSYGNEVFMSWTWEKVSQRWFWWTLWLTSPKGVSEAHPSDLDPQALCIAFHLLNSGRPHIWVPGLTELE